jgi:MMP 1-O-methyltransferase
MTDIQGWLSERAGETLQRIVRDEIKTPTVVELGSWKGRSTSYLARGIKERGAGMVYAVDTWRGTSGEAQHEQLLTGYAPDQLFDEFAGNIRAQGLAEQVTAIRTTTVLAARYWDGEPIGLLFIDAEHSYEAVRRDFELWSPHVEPGGIVVLDDVGSWAGPSRLISELPHWYRFAGAVDGVWITQKV